MDLGGLLGRFLSDAGPILGAKIKAKLPPTMEKIGIPTKTSITIGKLVYKKTKPPH